MTIIMVIIILGLFTIDMYYDITIIRHVILLHDSLYNLARLF